MKKKTPKQILEERRKLWRSRGVSTSLFLMCFVGVLVSQLLPDLRVTDRVLDASFTPLRLSQVVGSVVASVFIFYLLEKHGDPVGKKGAWGRLATKAFMMGFMFNDILGRISW